MLQELFPVHTRTHFQTHATIHTHLAQAKNQHIELLTAFLKARDEMDPTLEQQQPQPPPQKDGSRVNDLLPTPLQKSKKAVRSESLDETSPRADGVEGQPQHQAASASSSYSSDQHENSEGCVPDSIDNEHSSRSDVSVCGTESISDFLSRELQQLQQRRPAGALGHEEEN